MQKILRRVATAERVVAKRSTVRKRRQGRSEGKEIDQNARQQLQIANQDIQTAKQAIRDEWTLGPLAPKWDVGEHAGMSGAITEARFHSPDIYTKAMRNRRCQWLGGIENINIHVDDRVVLLDGPDKGRIGKIVDVDTDKAEVIVEGLNKSNIQMRAETRGENHAPSLNMEMPISISAIRLVHPIQDPVTGVTKDVIINELVHGEINTDHVTGKSWWDRIVPSLNIAIPWPKEVEPDYKDYKVDTLRIDVEKRTFVPTLLRPPMPESIIDELRGKYSRFRTRHEPEYIARLEAEEQAKQDRKKLMDSMRTPLQEFHRAERANKKKKGKPRLTPEMLEKIGEVMARNQHRTLNAPGISSSASPGVVVDGLVKEAAPVELLSGDGQQTTTTTTSV